MVEAAQWYSLLSVSSGAIALLLSAYVVRKIPNRRAGDTFVLAMVFFVLAGTFAYLLRTSTLDYYGPNTGPLTIARLFYFFHMLAVGFTASFIGQYFLGFALMRRRIVILFLQVSLFVVAIGVTLQVNTLENEYSGIGVVVEDAWATGSLALFATIFMSTALAVLVRTLLRNRDPVVRKQTILMTVGVVAHGITAETYASSRLFFGAYPPPVLTVSALAMAACFAVAVLRYKMLVVTPRKEEAVSLPRRFLLKGGRAYLVRERRPKIVFLAFAEAARSGSLGLIVTRRAPVEVREDYDLPATPIVWLTSALGQNHVPPTDLSALERVVREFLAGSPQGVVALEGIEYLATYNPPERLRRALHSLRDLATAGGGVLLVSADLGAAEESVAQVLEGEFEPLELPRAAEYAVEDVFVIEASGLLLTHASRDDNTRIDSDVMAGMLTAIMNFARTSFASGSEELRRLELGEKTVLIERSPRFILAIAARGTQPNDTHEEMRAFLDRAERRYGPLVAKWSGDAGAFPGLQAMTSRLFL